MAGAEELLANMRADETCTAGNEEIHGGTLAKAGEECRAGKAGGNLERV